MVFTVDHMERKKINKSSRKQITRVRFVLIISSSIDERERKLVGEQRKMHWPAYKSINTKKGDPERLSTSGLITIRWTLRNRRAMPNRI